MYLFLLTVVFCGCWEYAETLIMSNCKKKAPFELFLSPELFVVTSWIEALTFCWMSVLVFTSCRVFFCWAYIYMYTETLITSNCKKKAPFELFLKPELFVVTSWVEALTFCSMILLVFTFCWCFFFKGLCWNFDHVDHQAKSTALIISLAWITCCYLKNRGVKKAQQDSMSSWSSNAWTIATQLQI